MTRKIMVDCFNLQLQNLTSNRREMPEIMQEGRHARARGGIEETRGDVLSPKQSPVVAIGGAGCPREAGATLTIVKGPFRGARTQGGQGLKRHGGLQRRHISPRNSPHLASNVPGTASARYTPTIHLLSASFARGV